MVAGQPAAETVGIPTETTMMLTLANLYRIARLPEHVAKDAVRFIQRSERRRLLEVENSRMEILVGVDVVDSDWAAWEECFSSWTHGAPH